MMVTVGKIAKEQKLEEGFRIVINDGKHGCKYINARISNDHFQANQLTTCICISSVVLSAPGLQELHSRAPISESYDTFGCTKCIICDFRKMIVDIINEWTMIFLPLQT